MEWINRRSESVKSQQGSSYGLPPNFVCNMQI